MSCGGRLVISFVVNEAVRAAPANGAAKNKEALILLSSSWASAAQCDMAIWTDRAPFKPIQLARRPGTGRFYLEIEPKKELATVDELFPMCDLS